ncbi:hypothetical protein GKQ38_04650 [Candidatus Nanohaloarchaea archaeon]|nr:hypothetical protein GKQ38_04650 [Candidatus Nanohaloarchaea archaeon]
MRLPGQNKNISIQLILIILAGVTAGVFTGIIPGIHPNTVVFTSLPYYFAVQPELMNYLVFIVAISVSHTFHDFLPAIFLHAPNSTTALSTMPGAEAVSKGEGLEAFYRTAAGGLIAVTGILVLLPALFLLLKPIYSFIEPLMLYILVFFLIFTVLKSDRTFLALQIAALAGFLGLYSFNLPVNQNYILIPVFTGLFAVPAMSSALGREEGLTDQSREIEVDVSASSGIIGAAAGLLAGVVPGIGPAISTSFLSPLSEDSSFVASLGGVNSSDIVSSLVALYLLNAPRSGASVAINQITSLSAQTMVVLVGAAAFSTAASFFVCLKMSRYYVSFLEKFSYRKIIYAVMVLLSGLIFYFTGFLGLLVLFTASMIGFCAKAVGERAVLMSVLMVPAVLFFSGTGVVM